MELKLKPFAYLDIDETMEFLKVPDAKRAEYRNTVIRLINMACKWVESYIDNPVLTRKYVEYRDGNSSNVLVPGYSPITKIHEIKIEFNRQFSSTAALPAENFVLRGLPDPDQAAKEIEAGNLEPLFAINGTDIVIRDDNNEAILGRLFAGSVLQSIKLVYDAGLAANAEDLPDDLKYATLLLVDHFYMARENRDIRNTSKSNNQAQQYSKKTGVPDEVLQILNDYKDYSLGTDEVPAKNNFTI